MNAPASFEQLQLTPEQTDLLRAFADQVRSAPEVTAGATSGKLGSEPQPGAGRLLLAFAPAERARAVAEALSRQLSRELHAHDLREWLSPFIAQTEKRLEELLDTVAGGVLFFDEAEALLEGGRARLTPQEISYVLQHFERFPGPSLFAVRPGAQVDPSILERFSAVLRITSG